MITKKRFDALSEWRALPPHKKQVLSNKYANGRHHLMLTVKEIEYIYEKENEVRIKAIHVILFILVLLFAMFGESLINHLIN
jgi:hypothetical protein